MMFPLAYIVMLATPAAVAIDSVMFEPPARMTFDTAGDVDCPDVFPDSVTNWSCAEFTFDGFQMSDAAIVVVDAWLLKTVTVPVKSAIGRVFWWLTALMSCVLDFGRSTSIAHYQSLST